MIEREIKKLYHLHIPKTGGRFIKDNILEPNSSLFHNNGIHRYVGESHANWDISFIDNKTYVISCFRDPIQRTISDYAHSLVLDNSGNRIVDIGKSKKMNRESFMSWAIENESYISDFQSKNFYIDDPYKNHLEFKYFAFYLNQDNIKTVMSRIKNTRLLLKTDNLVYEHIIEKISNDLNLYIPPISSVSTKNTYFNIESKNLYDSLNKEDLSYLEGINKTDYEIFYTDSLFYT